MDSFLFVDHRGLTFNWFEDGLHFKGEGKKEGEDEQGLVMTWKPEYDTLPDIPVYVNNAGNIIK